MLDFSVVISGLLTGLSLIVAIGAQNAYVLKIGLHKKYVFPVCTICFLGDFLLIWCGVFGIGAIVQKFPIFLDIFRYGGAAFLFIYGLLSLKSFFKSSGSLVAGNTASLPSLSKVLLTCLGFTFLNPHVYLDTMILLGSIASAYGEPGKYFFSMGACLGSFLWFYSLGYGARLLRPIFKRSIAWKVLDLLIAVVMFFIAGTLMFDQ